mmetsp:Transcript_22800/g.70517  ORF Transcript_22800/g.70517 Transcript_22800/m.70517 type:complete len:214 (+) Transcript_22800:89-730(+)
MTTSRSRRNRGGRRAAESAVGWGSEVARAPDSDGRSGGDAGLFVPELGAATTGSEGARPTRGDGVGGCGILGPSRVGGASTRRPDESSGVTSRQGAGSGDATHMSGLAPGSFGSNRERPASSSLESSSSSSSSAPTDQPCSTLDKDVVRTRSSGAGGSLSRSSEPVDRFLILLSDSCKICKDFTRGRSDIAIRARGLHDFTTSTQVSESAQSP